MAESLSPMEVVQEEMTSDSIAHRVNTIHRLPIIATVLGSEQSKATLLPYLDCKASFVSA
jgi:hypothetical protein